MHRKRQTLLWLLLVISQLAENTESEWKLFAGQAVNALKSEIATLVTDKIVNADVKALPQNKDFP